MRGSVEVGRRHGRYSMICVTVAGSATNKTEAGEGQGRMGELRAAEDSRTRRRQAHCQQREVG